MDETPQNSQIILVMEEHKESRFTWKPKTVDAPPDKGYAWIIVACSFIAHFFALGVSYIFGVYQQVYKSDPNYQDISNLGISLIGSLTSAGIPLFAIPVGKLVDRYGHQLIGTIGGIGYLLSFILASMSTKYWQLLLTQGLLLGMSLSFSVFPALAILSQWFVKRQGLATGIAVSGSGIGGLIMSPLSRFLISQFGIQSTLLMTGIVGGVAIIASSMFLRARIQTTPKAADYLKTLKNTKFQLLYLLSIIGTFGYFIPFFFLSQYAVQFGMTASQGALLIGLLNGASAIGRVVLGQTADKLGHINSLLFCMLFSSLSMLLIWPFAQTFASLTFFAIVFGLFVGGYISIIPTVIVQLFGMDNIAGTIGLVYSSSFFGTVFGPPTAGAFIDSLTTITDGIKYVNYIPVILYSGATMFVASLLLFAIRQMQSNRKLFVKV